VLVEPLENLNLPLVCARKIRHCSTMSDIETISIITFESNKAPYGQPLCGSLRKSKNDQ
jgi:hypothetical protein